VGTDFNRKRSIVFTDGKKTSEAVGVEAGKDEHDGKSDQLTVSSEYQLVKKFPLGLKARTDGRIKCVGTEL
tara:strand:+ start:202 stop:414 length:213 start_codon:yes stop_codon:yes gene_type:complete